MIDNVSRRKLLSATAVAVGEVSGCGSEGTTHASLSMDLYNVSNENGSYVIDMRPRVGVEGDWEPFRNVSVIVQNEQGNVICWHPIGNRSDNLILYREHLRSGNGVYGSNERVDQQVGIHNVSQAPSAMGADVDSDPAIEHSNIHIGELHWQEVDLSERGNPVNATVTPNPQLDIEVDYLWNTPRSNWEPALDQANNTFGLYGMSVEYNIDDNLTRSDLTGGIELDDELPPISKDDADEIEESYHDNSDQVYLLMATNGGQGWLPFPDFEDNQGGVASSDGDGGFGNDFSIVIFARNQTIPLPQPNILTAVTHETGHVLSAGSADDSPDVVQELTETRSGSASDDTNESVQFNGMQGGQRNPIETEWSVMAGGFVSSKSFQPMGSDYRAFSIEELSTVEFNRVVPETHNLLPNVPDPPGF